MRVLNKIVNLFRGSGAGGLIGNLRAVQVSSRYVVGPLSVKRPPHRSAPTGAMDRKTNRNGRPPGTSTSGARAGSRSSKKPRNPWDIGASTWRYRWDLTPHRHGRHVAAQRVGTGAAGTPVGSQRHPFRGNRKAALTDGFSFSAVPVGFEPESVSTQDAENDSAPA